MGRGWLLELLIKETHSLVTKLCRSDLLTAPFIWSELILSKTRVSNCHPCKLREGHTCSWTHYHHLYMRKSCCGETLQRCGRARRGALASLLCLRSLWLPQHWLVARQFSTTQGKELPLPAQGTVKTWVRGCQVLSHWVTLSFSQDPKSDQGNFRREKKRTSRKLWKNKK